jgi:hypothetical protein
MNRTKDQIKAKIILKIEVNLIKLILMVFNKHNIIKMNN